MIELLAPDLLSELRKCGWEMGRREDRKPLLTYCNEHRVPVTPKVIELMESLSGVVFPSSSKEFKFAVPLAYERLGGGQRLHGIIYETGLCLCPIATSPTSIVFMTFDGRFVALDDLWMGYLIIPTLGDLLAWMLHRPGINCEEHQLDMG